MTQPGSGAWRAVDRVLAEILGRMAAVEARLDAIEERLSTQEGSGESAQEGKA